MSRGFTLIELSIVLVLIGLLIGGVIGGAELIKQAQLQSFIKDIDKYETTINTFKMKYDALPGDMPNAVSYWGADSLPLCDGNAPSPGTCNGDGNGLVRQGGSRPVEHYLAWEHMGFSDIIPGEYSGYQGSSSNYEPGVNCPKLFEGCLIFSAEQSDLYIVPANTKNSFKVFGWKRNTDESSAIDRKIDDGIASRGRVVAKSNGDPTDCTDGPQNQKTPIVNYRLENTTANCPIYIYTSN